MGSFATRIGNVTCVRSVLLISMFVVIADLLIRVPIVVKSFPVIETINTTAVEAVVKPVLQLNKL